MPKINKKILVVEDEKFMLEALSDKLKKEGFKVLQAKNGQQGLETALRKHPDLILLDIVMPKVDGLTMLKNLRKDEWGKEAIVILLTNLNSTEKIAEAVGEGMHEYLIKSDWLLSGVVNKVKERLGLLTVA